MKFLNPLLFLLLLTPVCHVFSQTPDKKGYKIGEEASDFRLKNVNGKMVSLSDYKDAKGFILVFTCNTCPCSQANENRLNKLNEKYSSQGYHVVAINSNDPEVSPKDSFKKMKKRAREQKLNYPYLDDGAQNICAKYGALKTPEVFVLSKTDGKLFLEYKGGVDDNVLYEEKAKEHFVDDAVAALLKGEKPVKTITKAHGCRIACKVLY